MRLFETGLFKETKTKKFLDVQAYQHLILVAVY